MVRSHRPPRAVSPLSLRFVEQLVSALVGVGKAVLLDEMGHTHARCNHLIQLGEAIGDTYGNCPAPAFAVDSGFLAALEQHECFTADPVRADVAVILQGTGCGLEHGVADGVPVHIVDRLEMVEVDDGER